MDPSDRRFVVEAVENRLVVKEASNVALDSAYTVALAASADAEAGVDHGDVEVVACDGTEESAGGVVAGGADVALHQDEGEGQTVEMDLVAQVVDSYFRSHWGCILRDLACMRSHLAPEVEVWHGLVGCHGRYTASLPDEHDSETKDAKHLAHEVFHGEDRSRRRYAWAVTLKGRD